MYVESENSIMWEVPDFPIPSNSLKDLVLDDINVNDDKNISIVKAYPIGGHMKKVTVEIKNFDYILVFQLVNT